MTLVSPEEGPPLQSGEEAEAEAEADVAILLPDPDDADELPRGRQRFTTHIPSCRVVVLHAATVDMDAIPFNMLC